MMKRTVVWIAFFLLVATCTYLWSQRSVTEIIGATGSPELVETPVTSVKSATLVELPAETSDGGKLRAPEEPTPRTTGIRTSPTILPKAQPAKPGERLALSASGKVEPPDPIELGVHVLRLTVTDKSSTTPLRGEVELWRISAPSNANWGKGDQRQQRVRLDENGQCLFGELARGQYRAVVFGAPKNATYADRISVYEPMTEKTLYVESPARHTVYIRAFSSTGEAIQQLTVSRTDQLSYGDVSTPNWVKGRRLLVHHEPSGVIQMGASLGTMAYGNLVAGPEGFQLKNLEGPTRERKATYEVKLQRGDRTAQGTLAQDLEKTPRYIALLPDPEPLLESLVTPDGRTGLDLRKQITITGGIHPDTGSTQWTEVPVQVKVLHPEFEGLDFQWKPQNGKPRPRMLIAK